MTYRVLVLNFGVYEEVVTDALSSALVPAPVYMVPAAIVPIEKLTTLPDGRFPEPIAPVRDRPPDNVVNPLTVSARFTVTSPPSASPMLTFVVEPVAPPVPMLIVFVAPLAVRPVPMLIV